jgi:exonuclease III
MTLTLTPNLTFSAINCNSLNISTISSFHHKLKIYGITKLKTDVIFLSDIRIRDPVSNPNTKKIETSFLANSYCSYRFFFNSGQSSRGTGLLIKNSLNFSIEAEEKDDQHNVLGLLVSLDGMQIFLLSIYGPNKLCLYFFPYLEKLLQKYSGIPTILGGDWNLTPSSLPVELNLDVYSMKSIPNETHSKLLSTMQLKFSLVDPFRILHPNRRDYSYVPGKKGNLIDLVLTFF